MTEVTQADRDAAQLWCASQPFPSKQAEAVMIAASEYDHHSLVQAFARHRINHTRPASTEPADALAAENALLRAEIEERDEWTAIVDKMPLDAFDRLGDYWVQRHCTVHLIQAITSVFSRYADENIMARFRQSITDNLHLAFVEGCIAGSRNALTRTDALAEAREALELADAALRGAHMNMDVVERKVSAALSRLNAQGEVK